MTLIGGGAMAEVWWMVEFHTDLPDNAGMPVQSVVDLTGKYD